MLPLNLSDTAATSQDGSSLEFVAAIAGRQYNQGLFCHDQVRPGKFLAFLHLEIQKKTSLETHSPLPLAS